MMPLPFYKYAYIFLAALYFILPWDLDMLGAVGRIDDILVAVYLYYRYQRQKAHYRKVSEDRNTPTMTEGAAAGPDPFVLLGLTSDTSLTAVKERYEELIHQFDPDRIQHLSQARQKSAQEKRAQLDAAFKEILARHQEDDRTVH